MGIVLFANPTARSGDAAAVIERARRLLIDRGLKHRFIPTEPAGGTVERVRRAIALGSCLDTLTSSWIAPSSPELRVKTSRSSSRIVFFDQGC